MNRIEEIKERLNNFKTAPREGVPKGLPWDTIKVIGVWADNAPADVQYLLSKLEMVETTLQTANENPLTHNENSSKVYKIILDGVLKAIRE